MSVPFVSQIRARPGGITLDEGSEPRMLVRVEVPDVWDMVRVDASAATPVFAVKQAALQALVPDDPYHEAFVVKLNGFEVLDEHAPIADAGAVDGSTLLVTYRRRRPVR